MRLFVAIELSDEIKDALCAVMVFLRAQGVRGNYTSRENLHLTLAFIGESERIDDAISALNSVTPAAFDVMVGGFGFFWKLLWAGVEKNEHLYMLADDVQNALKRAGFVLEQREFVPHITLVRKMQHETCVLPISTERTRMTINTLSLMSSSCDNGMIRYSRVFSKSF